MERKFASILLKVSKLFVFLTFIYTAWVMYWLGRYAISGVIVLAVSLFLIFNKLESMSRGV